MANRPDINDLLSKFEDANENDKQMILAMLDFMMVALLKGKAPDMVNVMKNECCKYMESVETKYKGLNLRHKKFRPWGQQN